MKTRKFKYKLGHYILLWTIALSSIFGSSSILINNLDTYKQYSLLELFQNDDLRTEILYNLAFFILPIYKIIRSDAFEHWIIYNITRISIFTHVLDRHLYHWKNRGIYNSAKLLIHSAETLHLTLDISCFSEEQYFYICEFTLNQSTSEKINKLEQLLQEKTPDLYIRQNSKNKFTLYITKSTET